MSSKHSIANTNSMKSCRQCFFSAYILIGLIAVSDLFASENQPVNFSAQGSMDWIYETKGQPEKTIFFNISRFNACWLIDAWSSDENSGHTIIGSDGSSLYTMHLINSDALISMLHMKTNTVRAKAIKSGEAYQQASVYPTTIPTVDLDNFANLVWLVFINSCNFTDTNIDNQTLPASLFCFVNSGTNVNLKVTAVCDGSVNKTLTNMTVFSANNFSSSDGVLPYPHPYEDGFPNLVISINGFKNVGKGKLPESFRLDWFSPDFQVTNFPLTRRFHFEGRVNESGNANEETTGVPQIKDRLIVTDYRSEKIYSIPYISYHTDPSKGWLAPVSKEYANVIDGGKKEALRIIKIRTYFIVTLFSISALFLVLIIKGAKLKNNQNKQENYAKH
jgi:hypothetical protein